MLTAVPLHRAPLLLCLLTGCALWHERDDALDDRPDAQPPLDAAQPTDAGLDVRLDAEPDAAAPLFCETSPHGGFEIEALSSLDLDPRENWPVAMAGDADSTYLAVWTEGSRTTLLTLDSADVARRRARVLGTTPGTQPTLSLDGQVARMTVNDGDGLTLVEARGERVETAGAMRIEHASRMINFASAWNGTDVLVGAYIDWTTIAPFRAGELVEPWFDMSVRPHRIAADPRAGDIDFLYDIYDASSRTMYLMRVAEDGSRGAPVNMGPYAGPYDADDPFSTPRWHRVHDFGQSSLFFATARSGPDDAAVVTRSYFDDGTITSERTYPLERLRAIDVAMHPSRGQPTGHGIVALTTDGDALFRGTVGAHESEWAPLPFEQPCARVSISQGPCGFVVACTSDARVLLARIAVPLRPTPAD